MTSLQNGSRLPFSKSQRKLRELMERANQIGAMLPEPEDIDFNDLAALAEAKMLLQEYSKVVGEINAMILKHDLFH